MVNKVEDSQYNNIKPTTDNPLEKKETVVTDQTTKKKVQQLVKAADAKEQKVGLVTRFVRAWGGPRGFKSIRTYVFKEVLIPAAKDMIADGIKSGVDIALGQGTRRNAYSSSNSYWGKTKSKANEYRNAYNRYSSKDRGRSQRSSGYAPVEEDIDIRDGIIANREDAVAVLDEMRDVIEQYGQVSVADYYDLIGFDPEITDNSYGWTDLSSARVVSVYGREVNNRGYQLDLPEAEAI